MIKGSIQKRFVAPVRKYFSRKQFTLVFAPHSSGKSLHINITSGFIYLTLAVFIIIIANAGFVISRYFTYRSSLIAESTLKDKIDIFGRQLIQTQAYLENVKYTETRTEMLLGLKDKQPMPASVGLGGANVEEANNLARQLRDDYRMSDTEFNINLDIVNRDLNARLREWQTIQAYIREQKKVFIATPVGMPVLGRIVSFFGYRVHPIRGGVELHQGIDIDAYRGTPVRATASGYVTFSNWASGYGQLVVVDHGYGFSTRYAHMSKIKVRMRQKIKKGDIVGNVGSTGTSTGDHLHYEVRINEHEVNPIKYLRKQKI